MMFVIALNEAHWTFVAANQIKMFKKMLNAEISPIGSDQVESHKKESRRDVMI